MAETIIVAIIGSGALSALIAGIFQLINNRKSKRSAQQQLLEEILTRIKELEDKQVKSEKDAVRLQLLLLMANYPEKSEEILTAAQHYFVDLKANWFLTPLFYSWMEAYGVAKPEWFIEEVATK